MGMLGSINAIETMCQPVSYLIIVSSYGIYIYEDKYYFVEKTHLFADVTGNEHCLKGINYINYAFLRVL